MLEREVLAPLIFLGIILIIIGVVLLILPIIARIGVKLEEVHPLILLGRRFDGIYIGTSPILIIILAALYLVLLFLRRG